MLRGQKILTVIFGAGASYGSAIARTEAEPEVSAQPPPLTSGLFSNAEVQTNLKMRWPQLAGLIPQLHGHVDLEARLESILNAAVGSPDEDRIEVQLRTLRFYLRDIIRIITVKWTEACGNVTAFDGLLWQIEAWRRRNNGIVLLVSFNYDDLLERAVTRMNDHYRVAPGQTLTLDWYVAHTEYRIYKPHGSENWAVQMDSVAHTPDQRDEAAALNTELHSTGHIQVDEPPYRRRDLGAPITMPAISVPTLGKAEFSCPSEHVADLRERIPHSDYVLAIGWQGRDRIFDGLIRTVRAEHIKQVGFNAMPQPRILVIDPLSEVVDRVRTQLRDAAASNRCWEADDGDTTATFSAAVQSGMIADWLAVGAAVGAK
ncbi:MAG: SIR2 family protein [Candidatus Limnocylindrales bacterium]